MNKFTKLPTSPSAPSSPSAPMSVPKVPRKRPGTTTLTPIGIDVRKAK